jgi:transcriptional regulator with XRE-family HTH domain
MRVAGGLTIRQLEEQVGINRGVLSRIEHGFGPSPDQAQRLLAVHEPSSRWVAEPDGPTLRLDGPVVIGQCATDPGDMGEPRVVVSDGITYISVPLFDLWPRDEA